MPCWKGFALNLLSSSSATPVYGDQNDKPSNTARFGVDLNPSQNDDLSG